MASATPSLSDLFSEDLKCAICLHRLKRPRALGCLHSFCEKCLFKYVGDKAPSGPVVCPLCQKETALPDGGVAAFPSDFRAMKLIELVKREKRQVQMLEIVNTCDVCEKSGAKGDTAFSHCSECAQVMCEQCGNAHGRMRISQDHTITPVSRRGQSTSSDAIDGDLKELCSNHEENKLDTFCTTCLVPVCEECIVTDHPEGTIHKNVPLFQFVPTMREQLSTQLSQVAEKASDHAIFLSIIDNLESTMTTQRDAFNKNVEIAIRQLSQHITRWKLDINAKREEILEGPKRDLTKFREKSERLKERFDAVDIKAKALLKNRERVIDLALSFRSLKDSLDQLLKEKPDNSEFVAINNNVRFQLQFHTTYDEPRIGNIVLPDRGRKKLSITNCSDGPYAATFTRDRRIAIVGKFEGAASKPINGRCFVVSSLHYEGYRQLEVTHYATCQYYAIKQTGANYKSSTSFRLEFRLKDECTTLASLSDLRFASTNGILPSNDDMANTCYNLEYPGNIRCIMTDFVDNIYITQSKCNTIYIFHKNGSLRESINTHLITPILIALRPSDPKEILVTSPDDANIYVLDSKGQVLRTINHPAWKEVAIGMDNDGIVYVLWRDSEDCRTLQRYSVEGYLIDTLFELEKHVCKKLILAVSPDGTAAVVTGEMDKAEITLFSTTREWSD